MRLTQIRQILEIDRCTSISQAARNLYISQPALSATLNEFETEIGVQLFERTKSGVKPTEDGVNILNAMKNIMNETEFIENYTRKAEELTGELSILIGPSYEFLLPEIIQRFKKNFPKANLRITNNFISNVQNQISKGHLDFSILALDDYLTTIDLVQHKNICITRLKDCRSYAVLNQNHSKSTASTLYLSEIIKEQLILGEQYYLYDFMQVGIEKNPITNINRDTILKLIDQNYAIFIDATPLPLEYHQRNYPSYKLLPIIDDLGLNLKLEWQIYLTYKHHTADILRQVFLEELKDLLNSYELFY